MFTLFKPKQSLNHVDPNQGGAPAIRFMIRRDKPEVLAIENELFEFPWDDDVLVRYLRQQNCIGLVAEYGDCVVGYMVYELHTTYVHLLNLAMARGYQRRGIGTKMVTHIVKKLSVSRRPRLTLEVRETNLAAQLFFRAQGFRAVAVLRGYYVDPREDAYLMQYRYRPPAAVVGSIMSSACGDR